CASRVMPDSSATVNSSRSSNVSSRTRVASANTFSRDDQPSRSIFIYLSRCSDKCGDAVPDGQAAPPRRVRFNPRAGLQLANSLPARGAHVDFGFSEEQLMIQDVARRIAQEKIAPSAEYHDRTGEFPLENIRTLGENGLMGIEVPAEYGGAGMDPVAYVLAMVEIAAADAAHSTIM